MIKRVRIQNYENTNENPDFKCLIMEEIHRNLQNVVYISTRILYYLIYLYKMYRKFFSIYLREAY